MSTHRGRTRNVCGRRCDRSAKSKGTINSSWTQSHGLHGVDDRKSLQARHCRSAKVVRDRRVTGTVAEQRAEVAFGAQQLEGRMCCKCRGKCQCQCNCRSSGNLVRWAVGGGIETAPNVPALLHSTMAIASAPLTGIWRGNNVSRTKWIKS